MNQIIYYVACSLDGYICGEDEDISGYVGSGSGLEKYLEDLKGFDTVIMGRRTYEFGYKYGLEKGQPAYPHMKHFVFSKSLTFEKAHEQVQVRPYHLDEVLKVRNEATGDIYLCGGGVFAGWLLDQHQIDVIKVKLSPLILNKGVRMFEGASDKYTLTLIDTESHDEGMLINSYQVTYEAEPHN